LAIYSTFFLAEPNQLPSAFPDWKLPLAEPLTRTSVNPFTREEVTITTRAPEWEDFDPEHVDFPERQVVAMEGDYQTCLENRIPPFVQSQPHWCGKNLTNVELEPLVAAATGIDDPELESALYAHPALACGSEQCPDEFVARLKSLADSDLNAIAKQWAARMSTPEYTHSVSGDRISDDWSLEDAVSLLNPMAQLARRHTDGQSLYLLIES